jgi:FHA domain
MTVAAIEIDDAGLTAVREGSSSSSAASPGYAVYSGRDRIGLSTGWAAMRRSRLAPRNTCTTFWDRLDSAPLPEPFPPGLSHADLAHAHLSSLWSEVNESVDRVILLVPPWYRDAEHGLLLGISRACGIPVTGLVDSTVAAALGLEADSAIHLDIHLHRAAGVRVVRSDRLRRDQARSEEGAGILSLVNAWAAFIAEKFVKETRFDPLHSAAAEQRLYDEIPEILDSLRDRESDIARIEWDGREYAVEILREDVVRIARSHYGRIVDLARSMASAIEPQIRVSSRLAALPGFAELVASELSTDVLPLPPGIAAQNVLQFRNRLPHAAGNDGAVAFVASLSVEDPRSDPAIPTPHSLRSLLPSVPTHVLWEGVAYSLEPAPFLLGVAIPLDARGLNLSGAVAGISRIHCTLRFVDGRFVVEDHSRYGSYVNGRRVESTAVLRSGDRLRLGTPGVEVQLIEVRS